MTNLNKTADLSGVGLNAELDDEPLLIAVTDGSIKPKLTMMAWLATEGGRKCPMCGRYAKEAELGFVGSSGPEFHISAYGHLPGFGCNKATPNAELTGPQQRKENYEN